MSTDASSSPAESFVTKDEVLNVVRKCLGDLPPEVLEACRQAFDEHLNPSVDPANKRILEKGLFEDNYYAIHTSELNLLSEVSSVAKDAYQGLADHGLKIIGNLLLFLFRYRRRRAKLDKTQGLVLYTLKHGPSAGMTPEEILRDLPIVPSQKPSIEVVRHTLTLLRDMPLEGFQGKKADFVTEADDMWRPVDV